MAGNNPLESTIRESCKRAFERAGAWVVVKHQTGRGVRGVPDLLVAYRALSIPAEIKRPRDSKWQPGQIAQLNAAAAAGALACVLRSADDARRIIAAVDDYFWKLADEDEGAPDPLIVPEDLRPPRLEPPTR